MEILWIEKIATSTFKFNLNNIWIIIVLILIGILIGAICAYFVDSDSIFQTIMIFYTLIAILFFIIKIANAPENTKYINHYWVRITDYEEFAEKILKEYDIVEQKSEVLVILKDKEEAE